jgi:epoxide hydrolase
MTTTDCSATAIRRFRSRVPQAAPDEPSYRRADTRWTDELAGIGWDQRLPLGYLGGVAWYASITDDGRRHETALHEYPQLTAAVDGQNFRFGHVRSPEPEALPLIITYGLRLDSMAELLEIIGALTDPAADGDDPADAFHVVVPALPNAGLADLPQDGGPDARRFAPAFARVMRRLGYDRYGAHGGDGSAAIARALGAIDPDHVVGLHLAQGLGTTPPAAGSDPTSVGQPESARTDSWVPVEPGSTPTAVAVIGRDFLSVRHYADRRNNVMHWSALDRGGRSAARAVRDLLVADIRDFFRRLR